jgi:hypothetical protein
MINKEGTIGNEFNLYEMGVNGILDPLDSLDEQRITVKARSNTNNTITKYKNE